MAGTIDVGNLVGKVPNLCRVSNYLSSRVRGHGRLERTSPSWYFVVNLDPSLTPRCLAEWDLIKLMNEIMIKLGKIWLSLVHAISTRENIWRYILLKPRSLHHIALHIIPVIFPLHEWFASTFKRTHRHCPGYQHGQNMERSTSKVISVCPKTRSPTVVLLVGDGDEARRFWCCFAAI